MARKKSRQKQSVRKTPAKRTSQNQRRIHRHAELGVPKPQVDHFVALYKAKRLSEAESQARLMTERYPESAFACKALGTTLLEDGRAEEALPHLHRSVELDDSDPLSLTSLAAVYYQQGNHEQAVQYQSRAVELRPDYAPAQYRLAEMLQTAGKHFEALEHAKKAQEFGHDPFRCRVMVGSLLYQTKYFSEALKVYKKLECDCPGNAPVYNNLGNLYKDIGQYELAESYYQKALDVQPGYVMAYSNIFFAKHYNPNASQQEIIEFAKEWDEHFALTEMSVPGNTRDVAKPLRVGMISSGFRIHPVGQMIATALEHSRSDIHFYAYATNDYDDYVTQKIRESTRVWRPVRHLSQEALAQQIRDDAIDILIDLSGHGDGSCLQAISMRPAPLCIKWVGGLVNTMGLSSIDYLFSDSIETPEGVDDQYTEKLIRLPDDYICYMPCPYAPNTSSLPAIKNGYITLGCLNNPAKIGERLLAEWAKLMHELPESRLLLRGAQYESEDFCQWIRNTLGEQGIAEYRIILEGPAKHQEFLETYQRIDIALDSWPYSGGLTTCEALLMGVPVVTLPGPTFAGRHSATHLINAGLQELVTSSWEEYRQRVLELANDLPNLAVIRAGLRTVLHYSPVCDAPRFANHFNNALRAVWVRYCEGKEPEALTFNKEGELWFEDEKQPIKLPEARSEETSYSEHFEWQLDEPITIIDNAAVLPRHPDYPKWMSSGHLSVISFDPASVLNNRVEELQEYGELHHYPHALLGDGHPATLYAKLDAEQGSTLKPLPVEQQPEWLRDKLKVLAELPINTVALDQIEGLPNVDMLILDDLHDAMKVLENGKHALKETLLVLVKVARENTHQGQCTYAKLAGWASTQGMIISSQERDDIPSSERGGVFSTCLEVFIYPSESEVLKMGKEKYEKFLFLLSVFKGEKISRSRVVERGRTKNNFYQEEKDSNSEDSSEFPSGQKILAPGENAQGIPIGTSQAGIDQRRDFEIDRLKKALGDKKLVFLATGDFANHGLVQKTQDEIFDFTKRNGVNAGYANRDDVKLTEILDLVLGRDGVFFGANRYFDSVVSSSGFQECNIFENYNVPVIGLVGDHPYASFMMQRTSRAPRNGLFYGPQSLIDELRFLRPDIRYLSGWNKNYDAPSGVECQKPHYEREIDILVPMNLAYALQVDSLINNLKQYAESIGRSSLKLVNNVLLGYVDFSTPLMNFFIDEYKNIFGHEWRVSIPWSQKDVQLIRLLSGIDDIIRGRKRLDAMQWLASIDKDHRIVVLASEKEKEVLGRKIKSDVGGLSFIGSKRFKDLERLYKNSRYVMNVNPTYHDDIHARVRHGVSSGCAIISDKNSALEKAFAHDESIYFMEEGNGEKSFKNIKYGADLALKGMASLMDNSVLMEEKHIDWVSMCADYIQEYPFTSK